MLFRRAGMAYRSKGLVGPVTGPLHRDLPRCRIGFAESREQPHKGRRDSITQLRIESELQHLGTATLEHFCASNDVSDQFVATLDGKRETALHTAARLSTL